MSYHPITIDELVSAHRADLLREASNDDLAQRAMLVRGSHSWSMRALVEIIRATFGRPSLIGALRDVSSLPV
ncbi:MAG: hypothetical protein JOZ81_18425 [Chloroflexi bacterium]|nr:hypothetical protein [Chloroflexota bacterium]